MRLRPWAVCFLRSRRFGLCRSSRNDRKMYDPDNDDNDPHGFLRHNANTVNNDGDDDGCDDDDDGDNDAAGTVDAADHHGNEHADKAPSIFLEHAWLLITAL